MKLLFYKMSYLDYDLELIFKEKAIQYDSFGWKFKNNNRDDEFILWFEQNINLRNYAACFSIDYWPLLSELCQKYNVPYIAWSYDTPPNVLNIEETLGNSVNHIFWFDKTQYQQYKNEGYDTVYHMPLGVNSTRLGALKASASQHAKYDTEVSLVGKLYDSKYLELLSLMSNTYKTFFETLVNTQGNIFDRYIIDDMITSNMVADINNQIHAQHPGSDLYIPREALTYAVASEVTKRERIILLTLCGSRFKTRLYSYQDNSIIKNIERFPAVDYVTEMPLVFQCSKINLNPAFCMIQSGASLRAMDIMGAGGFMLSRLQYELLDLYKENDELVIYYNYEDAIDKLNYYMTHDDIRCKIAENGRRKTLTEHSLQKRLADIFAISNISL